MGEGKTASGIVIALGIFMLWAAAMDFLLSSPSGAIVIAIIAVLLIGLGWRGYGVRTLQAIILLVGALIVIGSIASATHH
jgi:hypothetical protein